MCWYLEEHVADVRLKLLTAVYDLGEVVLRPPRPSVVPSVVLTQDEEGRVLGFSVTVAET